MDYHIHYNNLIISRLLLKIIRINERKSGIYYESHHILPKSLNGKGWTHSYNHSNIVILTPKEHFIAHYLLTKIYPGNPKIIYAFWAMCNGNNKYRSYNISARTFSEARRLFNSCSPMKNKKHNILSKNKTSKSVKNYWDSPEGLIRKRIKEKCPNCNLISNPSNIKRHLKKCKAVILLL